MIKFNQPEDGYAIAKKAGCIFNPKCDQVIARYLKGNLAGGVLYQGHTGASIQMHVAGFAPHWLSRDMLWMVFHYPFVQLGVKKVFGQVGVHNTKALEFDRKLGFKEEVRIADVYPEGDMALMSMYKEDCKWLEIEPHGHEDASNGE